MRAILTGLVMLTAATAYAKSAPVPPDYGAPIEWEQFRSIAEAELKARLIDPASAQIEWPYLARQITAKALFSKRTAGYATCGLVNSRNRMGGYSGRSFVWVMMRDGIVTDLRIGDSTDELDTVATDCGDLINKIGLPPAPAPAAAPLVASSEAAGAPKIGATFAAVPDGVYISKIAPGGAAEGARLKPGMVIAALNGVPLKGIPFATVIGMLRATEGTIKLTIIGLGDVAITKAQ